MEPMMVGLIGLIALVILLIFGVHIGFSMAITGFVGFACLGGLKGGLAQLQMTPFVTASSYVLMALPLFLLMGNILFYAGIAKDLYFGACKWLGHLPSGLAMATIAGCAGFAALSGSSIATAGTIGVVAIPEMRRYGYAAPLAAGTVAAGGTLGILIPPSIPMIIYGYTTETSVGQLFIAGILPGILSAALFCVMLFILPRFASGIPSKLPSAGWAERIKALPSTAPVIILFLLIIGGIYLGIFTPTEAAAAGSVGAFIICLAMKRLSKGKMISALMDSARVTAMAMMIAMGAIVFIYFMSVSRLPSELAQFIVNWGVNRYWIIIAMLVVYFILGCFLDTLGMLLLTLPIFFPVVVGLGFDPVWFGILVTVMCEIGSITPPVGLNVYVIAGLAKDVPMEEIFKGIVPFLVVQIIVVAILVVFPQISLVLPSLMYGK